MTEPLDAVALADLEAALNDYEQRDNTNYYGRLIRLQVDLFNAAPALIAAARRTQEVEAALAKIGELHPVDETIWDPIGNRPHPWCSRCGETRPCRTRRILDGEA